ncbi:MAG: hypothetical protein H6999_10680 [Hahellaceae bacterium]|nr:hypothetical protein [Hahellaceae bacterium]
MNALEHNAGARLALGRLVHLDSVAPDLSSRDRSVVLALLSQGVGWVPLAVVREALPQFNQVDFSRSLHKLEAKDVPLIKARQNGRGKELRLTAPGIRVAKSMEVILTPEMMSQPTPDDAALPSTTQTMYLTGKAALNIPSKKGTGDWHFQEIFRGGKGHRPGPFPLAGLELLSTSHIFGKKGIVERSAVLKKMGVDVDKPVYVASHARAMADMVFSALKSGRAFENSFIISDWFPSETDQRELLLYLRLLEPHLTECERIKLIAWCGK